MSDTIRIGNEWYVTVASVRADNNPYVVKSDDTFALFDRFGDIRSFGTGEHGLYHEDTRFLSHLELTIDGLRPMYLGATVKERSNLLIVELMNPDLERDGEVALAKGEIHIFRAKLLWEAACHEHIRLSHHGLEPAEFEIGLRFDADFRDLFEVRGAHRAKSGERAPPVRRDGTLDFDYRGLDGVARTACVRLSPAPTRWGEREAHFKVRLAPGQEQHLYCTITCDVGGQPRRRSEGYEAAFRSNARARAREDGDRCRIESSNPLVDQWIDRSLSDLAMLTTDLPTGPFPYAGVPWYSTTFGRDALITARQMLWLDPSLARGVLACLAATQAATEEPERDAEPGKILHEARKCEMARTREVPFGRYYGTVDATPLFVALAGAYWHRTGDLEFIRGLWPQLLAALDWIDRYGDRDGDGFVEYQRRSSRGLVQQGWKDSHDSIFHADGHLAEGPIALCEVQAYVYEARLAAAQLAAALGDSERAAHQRAAAAALQREFQARFWCEELGTYAIALDGEKRPCRIAASNAGHALWCGLASPGHAARMAERFLEADFFSGWGIRTVASGQARYNPMSYHNGSVWPHDNALIALGLARYGHTDAALRVMNGLFEATLHFAQHRVPELFCGFPRREGEGPTLYPVACAPQAWSAAAVFAMLEAGLGLQIDAAGMAVSLRAPRLPAFIDWLELRGLTAGAGSVDLLLQRYDQNVGVRVVRKSGPIEVHVAV